MKLSKEELIKAFKAGALNESTKTKLINIFLYGEPEDFNKRKQSMTHGVEPRKKKKKETNIVEGKSLGTLH